MLDFDDDTPAPTNQSTTTTKSTGGLGFDDAFTAPTNMNANMPTQQQQTAFDDFGIFWAIW